LRQLGENYEEERQIESSRREIRQKKKRITWGEGRYKGKSLLGEEKVRRRERRQHEEECFKGGGREKFNQQSLRITESWETAKRVQ